MKTKLKPDKNLNLLKALSILIFLAIARNNEHVIVPLGFVLITSLLYVFTDFKHVIIQLIAIIGLISITFSFFKKKKVVY